MNRSSISCAGEGLGGALLFAYGFTLCGISTSLSVQTDDIPKILLMTLPGPLIVGSFTAWYACRRRISQFPWVALISALAFFLGTAVWTLADYYGVIRFADADTVVGRSLQIEGQRAFWGIIASIFVVEALSAVGRLQRRS